MTQSNSVVTPERFAAGLTYREYMERIERNRAKFEYNCGETRLSDDDARAFRELAARPDGPAKVLALSEDWCPDVFRGLPVMARIAEAAGMELRIFSRDQNLDIMDEFLKQGQHRSIPTFVFYTRDQRYLAHWIERPALANEQMHLVTAIFEGKTAAEALPEYERFQQGDVWADWRQETVREIRALLTSVCP
jgi:thiol-disulfide isomerase/thioredoxin